MKTDADIVVIGSGLGGLQVALTMAKEDRKVLVLERQHRPGGCLQSFARGKMQFNTGAQCVGGLGKGEMMHEPFSFLGLMDMPWQQMDPDCGAEVHVAGQTFVLPQGQKRIIDALKQYFPEDEQGLDTFGELMQSTDDTWLLNTNAWDYLNSIFNDKMLLQLISALACFRMELCRETLSLFTFVHMLAPYMQSCWRLKHATDSLVDKMLRQIKSLGGEVLTGKEVVLLKEEGSRISEAVCADGSRYAAQWFVSNVHPKITCDMLDDGAVVKKLFGKRLHIRRNTCGMFTVHLQIKSKALAYFNHDKIVVSAPDCWDMAVDKTLEVKAVIISARVPAKGENVANIDIMTPMKWEVVARFDGTKPMHRPKAYKELKAKVERRCMQLAETVLPGLASKTLKTWTTSPLTYKDRNNSPEGTAFGMCKSCKEPMKAILSPRTPIANLLLTGQNLMLHGVHGVTMAAAYTCQEIN